MKNDEIVDAQEPEEKPTEALEVAEKPYISVPGQLDELASQLEHGLQVVKARANILVTARQKAIGMTLPEDWLLFRDKKTGIQIGYLQDAGCQRVRPIFGICTENVRGPEKIMLNDGSGNFCYIFTADGLCKLTGERIENLEGGRSSTDDFVTRQDPPLQGIQLELAVRKAARANLDGNITRKLAGLSSVPYEEIQALFRETPEKTSERFRRGRGYGAQAVSTNVIAGPERPPVQPHFTPMPPSESVETPAAQPAKRPAPRPYIEGPPEEQDLITDGQRRRLYAIWKQAGWKDTEAKQYLESKYGIKSTNDVPRKLYEQICKELEDGGSH